MIVRVRNRYTASVGTIAPGAEGFVDDALLAGRLGRWLVRVDVAPPPPSPVEPAPLVETAPLDPEPPPAAPSKRKKGGDS